MRVGIKFQRQFRMWLPTMPMTMVSARSATETRGSYAVFRIWPRMTKHEIKEYLMKIYHLPVIRIHTDNYMGKRKRVMTERRVAFFKYKDYKRAFVYFDDTLKDIGIGMRIPELQEDEGGRGGGRGDGEQQLDSFEYSTSNVEESSSRSSSSSTSRKSQQQLT